METKQTKYFIIKKSNNKKYFLPSKPKMAANNQKYTKIHDAYYSSWKNIFILEKIFIIESLVE